MPRPHGRPIAREGAVRAGRYGVNAVGATIHISGVEQLDARLAAIQRTDAKRIVRRAVNIGLRIVQRAIQSEIQPKVVNTLVERRSKKTGKVTSRKFKRKLKQRTSLKRSIGIRFVRTTSLSTTEGKVGVGVGKKRGTYNPAAVFQATGTVERRRKKIGGFYKFITNPTPRQLRTGRHDGDDFVGRGWKKSVGTAEKAMAGVVEHELKQFWQQ
jgi:hypothetical protein